MFRPGVLGAVLVAAATSAAGADPPRAVDYVIVEPAPPVFAAAPDIIYLDRCASGCTVTAGGDDAARGTSSILGRNGTPDTARLAAFRWGDEAWQQVVACVRATYAPYDVTVVTDRPASGPYVRVIVAGEPAALDLAANTLGVAPLTADCSPQASAIAFTFANVHAEGAGQVLDICTTAAHEAGHVYGLDHEFECKDPMTYLVGCGAKVFLNRTVACGEFDGPRACKCGETQSSFRKLTKVLGAGPAPAGPELQLLSPVDGATVGPTFSVFVRDLGRPLSVAELWVNGAKVSTAPGKSSDSPYELRTTAALPDGVLRLAVRAYDDLGRLTVLTATVQKGAACTAASCPAGARCEDGACVTAPGTAGIGDPCASDGECASQLCAVRDGERVCSQPCWPSGSACAGGDGDLSCQHADDERLVCLPPPDTGGCCSAGGRPTGPLALALLLAAVLGRRRSPPATRPLCRAGRGRRLGG
jgi:hypothetical protein